MRVRDEIARKYWTLAARDEVRAEYESQGFHIEYEARLGDWLADLCARKEERLIVIEFKSGRWSAAKADEVKQLRNYAVHALHADFKLVYVEPPLERSIEVESLDEKLFDLLVSNFPVDLDSLSTHSNVENVIDLDFTSVYLGKGRTLVKGWAQVEVELVYGSESDERHGYGFRELDSFPLHFELELDSHLGIAEVAQLEVDTSAFYG